MTEASRDVEVPLLRAIVGYRLVSAVWLAMLAGLILAERGRPAERPWAVAVTIAVVTIWTAVATVVSFRATAQLRSAWFIGIDVAISIGSVWIADLAETFVFAGGYPLAAVFATLQSRGTFAGMFAAGTLSLTALARLGTVTEVTASQTSFVIVYLFSGAAAAWAFAIIRNADRRRIEAEAALLDERTERARAEERTQLASQIHDSVLQTLALIQREGDDPRRVRQLARRQERDLRSWLFGPAEAAADGLNEALANTCSEVEEMTGVTASLVTVGPSPSWNDSTKALVKATREALVNAAKHSGVDQISVYAETAPAGATVFVRDRGVGFDPTSVPSDRRGIVDSIEGRLAAVGGRVTIRTQPGGGTEVRLDVPWSEES